MLPNGLRIAVTPLPHLSTASIVCAVRVGSRYETREQNGISHFLEHMLFRGTAAHPTSYEFNLAIEELGGTLTASTHADFTTFDVTVPPEHAPRAAEIIAEVFGRPALRHLELEKGVVREEILETLDEEGRLVDADELSQHALFGEHPLGQPIGGSELAIEGLDEAALRAWHAQHYLAANTVLSVAGRVDADAFVAAATRAFGGIAAGERRIAPPFVRAQEGPRFTYVDSVGSQTDVRIVLPAPGERDPRLPAMEILSRVLDDGMSTRLFRTIVEDTGLAYETFGDLIAYEDVGVFTVGASIAHDKTPELVRTLLSLLDGLRKGEIEPAEIERARRRYLFALRASVDDSASMAELAATSLLFENGESLDQLAARVSAVSIDDVRAVARDVLVPHALQVVAVGTLSERAEREARRIVERWTEDRP